MYRALPVQMSRSDLWKIEISHRVGNGPWKIESYEYEEGLAKRSFQKKRKKESQFPDQVD
jgi:hypothetical protein